jgi:hypothetical protein
VSVSTRHASAPSSLSDRPSAIPSAPRVERVEAGLDPDSAPGRPVFNRTVGLRDLWAKVQAGGG